MYVLGIGRGMLLTNVNIQRLFSTFDMVMFIGSLRIVQVSDQTGALFGECCFEVGDIKCTMGTGTFIDLNCGSSPHASVAGNVHIEPSCIVLSNGM